MVGVFGWFFLRLSIAGENDDKLLGMQADHQV